MMDIDWTELQCKFHYWLKKWLYSGWKEEIVIDKDISYHFTINEQKKWNAQCRRNLLTNKYTIAFNFAPYPTDCTANEAVLNFIYGELEEWTHWGMNNVEVSDDHSEVWKDTLLQLTAESVDKIIWAEVDGEGKRYHP
jgi:hypothetical protein